MWMAETVTGDKDINSLFELLKEGSAVHQYIKRLKDRYGLGMPSTCGYNIVGVQNQEQMVGYFTQAHFSVRLHHCHVHHFLGFLAHFPHCTEVPFLLYGDAMDSCMVQNHSNSENDFRNIIAWGAFGGTPEYRRRRAAREAAQQAERDRIRQQNEHRNARLHAWIRLRGTTYQERVVDNGAAVVAYEEFTI